MTVSALPGIPSHLLEKLPVLCLLDLVDETNDILILGAIVLYVSKNIDCIDIFVYFFSSIVQLQITKHGAR